MKFLKLSRLVGIVALGLTLVLTAQTPKPPTLAQTLRASRWHQRLLLLVAPTAEQAEVKAQQVLLAGAPAELAERDVLVLDVLHGQLSAADRQWLTRQIGGPLPAFALVLIGKDGGVKRQSLRPLAPAELFETIDQMPMRRREMRRRPAAR